MAPRRVLTDSPFDTLEKTFDLLVTGPNPLALDGTSLDDLEDRAIPLGELIAMLLHPSMAFAARDAVVDELVARSRAKGGAWTVGLAGVLLPGLRRAVWPLVQSCPGKAADIEAETLAAFLAAVARCEPGRARLASRLCWLARIGANRLMRAEVVERARPGTDPVSAAPPRPWGHPDLVLERAVRAGVIGAADAELIGATRIGDVELAEVADALGISYKACHQRRRRAKSALVEWLTSDNYGDIAFDATNRRSRSRQSVPEQGRRGRPRQGERVVGQRV
jgi:hypothetical protein